LSGKLSSEQAIAQLVTAIDNIKGDQSAKLQAITDALNNKNNTLDTKLNVIAGTMKSLSTEMPTKIDALAKAVENMPEYYEVLKAVETALVNINPNEQLTLLEGVLDKYCSDERSMAVTSCAIACSLESLPSLIALTTSLKSLTTCTSVLNLMREPSSSHELKNIGVASSIAPANRIDFNVLIIVYFLSYYVLIFIVELLP